MMPPKIRSLLVMSMVAVIAVAAGAIADPEGQAPGSSLKRVTFTFTPMGYYENVYLAGTFNGWNPTATPMNREGDAFRVTLFLPDGEYQYKFVADGQWITDEKSARFHPDGYGGRNSVIDVGSAFEAVSLARGDGKIMTDGLTHDGEAWERALNADSTVTLRVRTWAGDVERVGVCWKPVSYLPPQGQPFPESPAFPQNECMDMSLADRDGTYDYWEARPACASGMVGAAYYFRLGDGDAEVILDRKGTHRAPVDDVDAFVYDWSRDVPFETPEWVKTGIIYQIFPDRFANGDRDNDPDFSEWYYEGVTQLPPSGKTNGEYFHMVEDWYDIAGLKVSPYKTDGKPDWNSFYGGDVEGVRQNLDYLVDLGITVIYFNPVFKAKSNHKYDAATFLEIDPHFGTNEEFAAFVADCHVRGIRVILDLAVNHTGHTYWAFVDAREKGEASPYWDWYEWKKWPVPGSIAETPANASDFYDCWWNFGQMPTLNFDLGRPSADENKIKDVNEAQPNWLLVDHLLEAAEIWLSEAGVDGYRLDVAADVPFWFWEKFRERVKSARRDAYIVGELWGSSPEWINSRYFDAAMNYEYFRNPVLDFIATGKMDAPEFDRALAGGRAVYPKEGVLAMMNLVDSHDTERFLTAAGDDPGRLKLAVLIQMTYVGTPAVYYGDEVAMEGGSDPDCRRPFYWKWRGEAPRADMHAYYRDLIALRKAHACFAYGTFRTLVANGMVYAYERSLDDDLAIVVLNAGKEATVVEIPVKGSTHTFEDVLGEKQVPVSAKETGPVLEVGLPALTGAVYMAVKAD
jgi:cyclomaltodextrinase